MFPNPEGYATPQKWLLDIAEQIPGEHRDRYTALASLLGLRIERAVQIVSPFPPDGLPLVMLYAAHAHGVAPRRLATVPLGSLKALVRSQTALGDELGVAQSWVSYVLSGRLGVRQFQRDALVARVAYGIAVPDVLRVWAGWTTGHFEALYRAVPDAYREVVGMEDAEVPEGFEPWNAKAMRARLRGVAE